MKKEKLRYLKFTIGLLLVSTILFISINYYYHNVYVLEDINKIAVNQLNDNNNAYNVFMSRGGFIEIVSIIYWCIVVILIIHFIIRNLKIIKKFIGDLL